MAKDEVPALQACFAEFYKEVFYNLQIEGTHYNFKDMNLNNSRKIQIKCNNFTDESEMPKSDKILKLVDW